MKAFNAPTGEQRQALEAWLLAAERAGGMVYRSNPTQDAFVAGWAAREAVEPKPVSPAPLEYQPMPGMTGITENYHLDPQDAETVIITPDGKHSFSFDRMVPMWIVHTVARAHADGVRLGAASAGASAAPTMPTPEVIPAALLVQPWFPGEVSTTASVARRLQEHIAADEAVSIKVALGWYLVRAADGCPAEAPKPAGAVPPGVVAILTDKDGDVVATAADFERRGYGGFTLLEAQKRRVTRALATAMLHSYCSSIMVEAMSADVAQRICDDMVARNGFRREIISVGHPA